VTHSGTANGAIFQIRHAGTFKLMCWRREGESIKKCDDFINTINIINH